MRYLLLLFTLIGCDSNAAQCNSFEMRHDIKWKNTPELPLDKVPALNKSPGGNPYDYWIEGADIHSDFPDKDATISLFDNHPQKQKKYYLNIEHLPKRQGFHTQLQMAETQQKLTNIAYWLKSERPEVEIGFYSVLPQREVTAGYWTQAWRDRNDYFKPLADFVDVVYPSLYTFHNDRAMWTSYVEENIKEAKKYGKPVIAFIWPRYHQGSPTNANEMIPGDYWRFQLETLYLLADGVIIWTGGYWDWNELSSDTDPTNWWFQTLDFMESKGL